MVRARASAAPLVGGGAAGASLRAAGRRRADGRRSRP
jgi:hypothetical protein